MGPYIIDSNTRGKLPTHNVWPFSIFCVVVCMDYCEDFLYFWRRKYLCYFWTEWTSLWIVFIDIFFLPKPILYFLVFLSIYTKWWRNHWVQKKIRRGRREKLVFCSWSCKAIYVVRHMGGDLKKTTGMIIVLVNYWIKWHVTCCDWRGASLPEHYSRTSRRTVVHVILDILRKKKRIWICYTICMGTFGLPSIHSTFEIRTS